MLYLYDETDVWVFMSLATFAASNSLGPCVDGSPSFRDSGMHRIYTAQFEILAGQVVDELELFSKLGTFLGPEIRPYSVEVYDKYAYITVFKS